MITPRPGFAQRRGRRVRPLRVLSMLATGGLLGLIALLDQSLNFALSTGAAYALAVAVAGWSVDFVWAAILAAGGWYLLMHATPELHENDYKEAYYLLIDDSLVMFSLLAIAWIASRAGLRQREIHAQISTDHLTGLANRLGFHNELERLLTRPQPGTLPFCLMYIDCDGFKNINDTHGHASGDRLLKEIAQQLHILVSKEAHGCGLPEGLAARLGGDEFALLLLQVGDNNARQVSEHIYQKLTEHFAGSEWAIGFSIGAAVFNALPASSDAALNFADQVMYGAKRAGGKDVHYGVFASHPH